MFKFQSIKIPPDTFKKVNFANQSDYPLTIKQSQFNNNIPKFKFDAKKLSNEMKLNNKYISSNFNKDNYLAFASDVSMESDTEKETKREKYLTEKIISDVKKYEKLNKNGCFLASMNYSNYCQNNLNCVHNDYNSKINPMKPVQSSVMTSIIAILIIWYLIIL